MFLTLITVVANMVRLFFQLLNFVSSQMIKKIFILSKRLISNFPAASKQLEKSFGIIGKRIIKRSDHQIVKE